MSRGLSADTYVKFSQIAIPEETPSLMQKEEEGTPQPQSPPPAYTDPSVKKPPPTGPLNPPPPPPPEEEEGDEEKDFMKRAPTKGSKRLERQKGLDSGKEDSSACNWAFSL